MEMVLRVMVVSVSHFAVCLNHKHVSSDHKDDLLQWINEIKLTDIPVQIAVYFNSVLQSASPLIVTAAYLCGLMENRHSEFRRCVEQRRIADGLPAK